MRKSIPKVGDRIIITSDDYDAECKNCRGTVIDVYFKNTHHRLNIKWDSGWIDDELIWTFDKEFFEVIPK